MNQSEFKETYTSNINILHLMEHFIDDRVLNFEEELNAIANIRDDCQRRICIEEIKFKMSEQQMVVDYNAFYEYIRSLLSPQAFSAVKYTINDFIKEKMDSEQLFDRFFNLFGPILVYKYFYLYNGTLSYKPYLKTKMEETLQIRLNEENYRHNNSLNKLKTWEDFFIKIKELLVNEVLERIDKNEIDLKKRYLLHKERMFQLIGSVKKSTFQELLHWKYLNNFLESVDPKTYLQRALLAPHDKARLPMSKISIMNLLICLCYFELSIKKMEAPVDRFDFFISKNQNLLKRFMRTNGDFAREMDYNNASEPEDYPENLDEENRKKREKELNVVKATVPSRPFKNMISDHPDVSKMTEIQRFQAKTQPKPVVVYENETTVAKKVEDAFPALPSESNGQGNLFDRMATKKKDILRREVAKIQPSSKTKNKDDPSKNLTKNTKTQKPRSNFEWIDALQSEDTYTSNLGDIDIDLERDFPALENTTKQERIQPKIEKKVKNVASFDSSSNNQFSIIGKIDPTKDFPNIEEEMEGASLMERMNKKKKQEFSTVQPKKKEMKKNDRPEKNDRLDKNELIAEKMKKNNKIKIDPFYLETYREPNERSPSPTGPEPEIIVENPQKKINLSDMYFPTLNEKKLNSDIFEKMNKQKFNKVGDLKDKFGYGHKHEEEEQDGFNPKVEVIGAVIFKKKKKK